MAPRRVRGSATKWRMSLAAKGMRERRRWGENGLGDANMVHAIVAPVVPSWILWKGEVLARGRAPQRSPVQGPGSLGHKRLVGAALKNLADAQQVCSQVSCSAQDAPLPRKAEES